MDQALLPIRIPQIQDDSGFEGLLTQQQNLAKAHWVKMAQMEAEYGGKQISVRKARHVAIQSDEVKATEEGLTKVKAAVTKHEDYLFNLRKNSLLKANAEDNRYTKAAEANALKVSTTWQREIDKFTASHATHSEKRIAQDNKEAKAAEANALKLLKYHNMLVKNSLPQGDNQRGLREMIGQGTSGLAGGLGLNATTLTLGGAAGALGIGLKDSVQLAAQFETSLTHLSNTTGVQGAALDSLSEKLRKTSVQYNTDLPDAITATETVLRSLGAEFKINASATDSATQSVLAFAKSQSITAEDAASLLTGTLHQYGLAVGTADQQSASLAKIMNVFAAATKGGNANLPELTEGMKAAGTMSHALGISFQETAAIIEVLSTNEVSGAEAGGKLALLFTKLSAGTQQMQHALARVGLTYDEINPEKVGLNNSLTILKTKLDEVGNPVNRVEIETQLFGQGARGAIKTYEAVSQNIQKIDELKTKITDTNTVQEQLNKIMETATEKYKHAKIALDEEAISLGQKVIPMITEMSVAVRHSIQGWEDLINIMNKVPGFNPSGALQDKSDQAQQGFSAMVQTASDMLKSKQTDRQGAFNMLRQYIIGSHNDLGTPQFNQSDKKYITDLVDGIITETNQVVAEKTNKDDKFGRDFKKKTQAEIDRKNFEAAKKTEDDRNADEEILLLKKLSEDKLYTEKQFEEDSLRLKIEHDSAILELAKTFRQDFRSETEALYHDQIDIHNREREELKEHLKLVAAINKAYKEIATDQKRDENELTRKIQEYNKEEQRKAAKEIADEQRKNAKELQSIFDGVGTKVVDNVFKPIEDSLKKDKSLISDIGIELLKLLEKKGLEAIANALFPEKDDSTKPAGTGTRGAAQRHFDATTTHATNAIIYAQNIDINKASVTSGLDKPLGGGRLPPNMDMSSLKRGDSTGTHFRNPDSEGSMSKRSMDSVYRGSISNGSGKPDGEISEVEKTTLMHKALKAVPNDAGLNAENFIEDLHKVTQSYHALELVAHGHMGIAPGSFGEGSTPKPGQTPGLDIWGKTDLADIGGKVAAGFSEAMNGKGKGGGGNTGAKAGLGLAKGLLSLIPGGGAISGIASILGFSNGGVVYAANGFQARGTDTVPAMLTPGERVLSVRQNKQYEAERIRGNGDGGSSADMSRMHAALERSNALLEHIASKAGYDPYNASNANAQNLNERQYGVY